MENAIIVFTKAPVKGQTKTRMMPYFSKRQCARLGACLLMDIRAACSKVRADLFVCYTPADQEGLLRPIFGQEATYFPQEGADLGARMDAAITNVLRRGYRSCVLVGTDVPALKSTTLKQAFLELQTSDIVFGPSEDGGYYLVGMNIPHPEVFAHHTYSHDRVLEEAVESLQNSGLSIAYTGRQSDLDERKDLDRFRDRMRAEARFSRSHTGHYLARNIRISVIVPIYNEEATIERMMQQLYPYRHDCEILFVDGGSTDQTLELIGDQFRVVHTDKGRARQMNFGAEKSKGDVLFFLHCDSELPRHFPEEIRAVMTHHQVGCFGIAFHSRNFFMLTNRWLSNHRARGRKILFGDQGIFIDRRLFLKMGGFPDIPIMEDYQFSLDLRQSGIRPGMTRHRIYTSDRRYPRGTIRKLKLMWKMYDLRRQYRAGISVEKIAAQYADIR